MRQLLIDGPRESVGRPGVLGHTARDGQLTCLIFVSSRLVARLHENAYLLFRCSAFGVSVTWRGDLIGRNCSYLPGIAYVRV